MNLLISISLLKEEIQYQWEILRTGLNVKNKNGGTLLKCLLREIQPYRPERKGKAGIDELSIQLQNTPKEQENKPKENREHK